MKLRGYKGCGKCGSPIPETFAEQFCPRCSMRMDGSDTIYEEFDRRPQRSSWMELLPEWIQMIVVCLFFFLIIGYFVVGAFLWVSTRGVSGVLQDIYWGLYCAGYNAEVLDECQGR